MGRFYPVFLILILALPVLPQNLKGGLKYYTPNDGISSGFISGITQDNQGFIWITTNEGLNRFDGSTFTTFYHSLNNPNTVSSNKLSGIEKDILGKLWIGNLNEPLVDILDPATLIFKKLTLPIPQKIKNTELNFIFASQSGSVFVNYRGSNFLAIIDVKEYSIEFVSIPPHNTTSIPDNIEFITETASGKIIIATTHGRIFHYNNKNNKLHLLQDFNEYIIISHPLSKKRGPVYAITASSAGWIFDDEKSVFSHLAGSEKYISQMKSPRFKSLHSDSSGNLWINTGFENIAFVPGVNSMADFSQLVNKKLPPIEIKSLFLDYENNIWIGSVGYGVLFFPDKYKKFTNFSHAKQYPDKDGVRSLRFIFKKNEKTYIAGYDGLQILGKNNHLEKVLFNQKPIRSAVYSNWGGKEILWLGPLTYDKNIFWYDINSGSTGSIHLSKLPENSISYYDIFEENEFLWLSTNLGIIKYDRKNHQMFYFNHQPEDPASLRGNHIRFVRRIDGKLVASIMNHGLMEIDPETGVTSPLVFNGYQGKPLPKDLILSILTDNLGDLWLGTNGEGLYHIDNQNKFINSFSTEQGLPNNTVYAVLNDKNGDIWGSTNQGIFRYDRMEGVFRNYNKLDGLIENEFNAGASFIDDEGTLFFGGITGFSSFKPEDIRINQIPPRMALINLTVNNIDYTQIYRNSPTGRITLPHDSNYISISFTSLTFNSSQHTKFAYKIEGIHSGYINLDHTRILQLNGLDEGVYNISITGTNSDGIWAEKPLRLVIVITPSFAESWVFYFIVFIVFVLTAISWAEWREKRLTTQKVELEKAVRERTHELELQNKEIAELNNELRTALTVKNKFLSIVAHDLKTPFTALLGYSEILSDDIDTLPKEQITMMISELGRLSQQTYGLILNLLNWTQLQTNRITLTPVLVNLREASTHCYAVLESNFRKKQISLKNEIPDNLLVFADKNMLNTILLNLVNNAYKFSNPGGEIRILAQRENKKVFVSVSDSGVGMTPEKIATLFSEEMNESYSGTLGEKGTGLGLLLIKELLDFSGQSIIVESEPDKGTKITFTLDIYEKETN